MEKNRNEIFLKQVSDILKTARKNVKTAVNLAMVYSYYEVGRMIVEEEQRGHSRADYGKYIIKELSEYLTQQFGKGEQRCCSPLEITQWAGWLPQ